MSSRAARAVCGAWRVARAAVHIAHGVWICAVRFPRLDRSARARIVGAWSARFLALLDVRIVVDGACCPAPALCVANHVSWLDILVLNAVSPSRFVAKADIRRWPVLGWLTACGGTLFIERGRGRDARRVTQAVADALRQGDTVSAFPEGTTSDGHGVLPFHTGLLQAAVVSGLPVQPAALRYSDAAGPVSAAAAFVGDMTLWRSAWNVVTAQRLCARVTFAAPIDSTGHARHHLAATARGAIIEALAERPARAGPD